MAHPDEYVTRGEFRDFTNRTETRIDNIQKDMYEGFQHMTERMDEGFQHITERMDEGFQRMEDRFQHLTERMNDKVADIQQRITDESDKAAERARDTRKYWWALIATAVGSAAGIIGLFFR